MAHLELGEAPRSKATPPRQNYPPTKNGIRGIQEEQLEHRQCSSNTFEHLACTGLACPLLLTAHHRRVLKPWCESWAATEAWYED